MDSNKINEEIQKHYKAIKAAAKAAQVPKKPAAAKKIARKATKSAAKKAKATAKRPPKPSKIEKATKTTNPPPAAKPTKAKRPAAARPDFKPVKLPATFDGGDGSMFTVTAAAITFSRGLREIIFDPRRAHFFPHDVTKAPDGSPLPQPIKAGSVSLIRGQSGVVISADDADAVAAILTAKAAALEAARKAKGVKHD